MGLAVVALVCASCSEQASPPIELVRGEGERRPLVSVARGERLTLLVACDRCHTPQKSGSTEAELDFAKRLSGHPEGERIYAKAPGAWGEIIPTARPNTVFTSPWGERFASNLTPDPETGIGAWSEETFVHRMAASQHWVFYSRDMSALMQSGYYSLSDEDLRSIFAYLQTLPPVRNRVPDSKSAGDWEWQ